VTVFFYGVGHQPVVDAEPITVDSYTSADNEKVIEEQGCRDEAAKITEKLLAQEDVRGVATRCVYVPVKDKV
jgi:hypothetical protein